MSWKFWTKKKEENQQHSLDAIDDLYALSILAGALFARNAPPFDDWCKPTIDVPAHLKYVFQRVAQGFQIWNYIVLIGRKYGTQASRLALDALCLQAERYGGTPDARVLSNFVVHAGTVASRAVETAEIDGNQKGVSIPWEYFAAKDMLISVPEQPYYGKTDSKFEGNEELLGRCIQHAMEHASVVFDVMLRNVHFTPDTFLEWLWSTRPGGYERNLQRRWNNPLFPEERRKVTATDVYHAWIEDGAAISELENKVNNFLKSQPDHLPLDWQKYCNETRVEIDNLLKEASKIGGDNLEIVDTLQKVRNRIINTWKAGLGDNKQALENLEYAELENNKYNFLDSVFVQHAYDRDYISLEDLGPALLCEPIENIQAYCKTLIYLNEENPINKLQNVLNEIIRDAKLEQMAQGQEPMDWKDKLEAIDSCKNMTKKDLMG